MSQLGTIIGLLFAHWVGDFVLQSHYMSITKSKSIEVLGLHVLIWFLVVTLGVFIFTPFQPYFAEKCLLFAGVNGVCHFATDAVTSRINSYLWADKQIHNFFVMIGFDQLIHQVTLILTFMLIFT